MRANGLAAVSCRTCFERQLAAETIRVARELGSVLGQVSHQGCAPHLMIVGRAIRQLEVDRSAPASSR